MTKQEVIDLMKSSKDEKEWNLNCDTVQKVHNGHYPDYWFSEIISSGLFQNMLTKQN